MSEKAIAVGERFEDFGYETAWETGKSLYGQLAEKTILVFSRYIGCPPCLMELMNLAERYPRISARDGQLLVVMQSAPTVVRETLEPGVRYKGEDGEERVFGRADMPYDLICDPDCALYKRYGIRPAKNKVELVSVSALAKAKKSARMGLEHGKYEGDELQLPATFLLDQEGTVLFAHYGKSFADYLSEEAMLELLG